MARLSDMPNIGPVVERKLISAGIETPEKLVRLGSKEAFLRMRSADGGACLSMLCGLEGAIRGIRWHRLPGGVKQGLKAFFDSIE